MRSYAVKQSQVLRYIVGYVEAHDGIAPKLDEIGAATRLHKSGVHLVLCRLSDIGCIERKKHKARWIDIKKPISIPRGPDAAPLYFVRPM